MQTKRFRAALVTFGLAGHHVDLYPMPGQYSAGYHSGYCRPDNWQPDADGDYSAAVVLDKRGPLEADPGLAYRSPMPGTHLEQGEIDKLWGGRVRAPLAAAGGYDLISPADFVTWWRHHGARVGRVTADGIEWEPEPEPAAPSHTQSEFTL